MSSPNNSVANKHAKTYLGKVEGCRHDNGDDEDNDDDDNDNDDDNR